ncbi:MAG: hypothetical protein ACREHG_07410 [Candidatus Saccharimonadales bacterium]
MRTPLPFEEQRSFNTALFFEGITAHQVERLFMFLGYDWQQARIVPFIVNRYGISNQPAGGGRVVTLVNPENGYDVALDVW